MYKGLILLLASLLTIGRASASPPAAKPVAEEDPQAKRITGSANYFRTFGLRASIVRGLGVNGVIAVDAGLDIPDEETRKRAEAMRPRVISQMREAVLDYGSQSYIVGERPDLIILKSRLQKAADQVLGKGESRVTIASCIVFKQ